MTPDEFNQKQIDEGKVTGKHLTRLTKLWQENHLLDADAKLGKHTLHSVLNDEILDFDGSVIDDAPTDPTRQLWDVFDGPLSYIPRGRKDVYELFGNPSNGPKVDKKWLKENIRTYRKAMALPGVDPHRYVKLHKLAEPYVREALRRAALVSDYRITRFGAFNYRLMRSKNKLSYHSFGIAFDINPPENPAIRYKYPKDKPVPWSDEWHEIRPNGMDKPFVDAIKSVGFGWGGDWKTFADDMHFELVLP